MPVYTTSHPPSLPRVMGGMPISNSRLKEMGTLGFIATSDGTDRWLVSCYHVLCGPLQSPSAHLTMEPIVCHVDQRRPPVTVAILDSARTDKVLDAAAALIVNSESAFGRILGIGAINPNPIGAYDGMRVIKSGIATGVTEGIVRRIDAATTIEIQSCDPTTEYVICKQRDSGALWLDAATMRPVGLHCSGAAGNETRMAIATPITQVLERLRLRIRMIFSVLTNWVVSITGDTNCTKSSEATSAAPSSGM